MTASLVRSGRRAVLAVVIAAAGLVAVGPAGAQDLVPGQVVVTGLKGVSCASVTSCFAAGGDTVVAMVDGGTAWTVVTSPPGVFDLASLACRSATRCLAVGSGNGDAGAVYGTVDAGMTWRVEPAILVGGFFFSVSCPSRAVCVATGNAGEVFSTENAGRAWTEHTLTDASLITGVDCVTTTVCEAVAYSGRNGVLGLALRSTDGGHTWAEQDLPAAMQSPEAVACPSVDICVAVGQDTIHAGSKQLGVIAVTQDGGSTWRRQQVPDGYTNLAGVACPAPGICEVVGYGPQAILGTVDGGRTWKPQGPRAAVLQGISCPTTSTCVAVGQTFTGRGAIYRTRGGGNHWHRQLVG